MGLFAFGANGVYDLTQGIGQAMSMSDYQNLAAQQAFGMYNQQQSMQTVLGGLANAGVSSGFLQGASIAQQYVSPPALPTQKEKKKPQKRDEEFHATDEMEFDHTHLEPKWKRRLMKRYGGEATILEGFVKRLAFEIDMWHANAAGFPA